MSSTTTQHTFRDLVDRVMNDKSVPRTMIRQFHLGIRSLNESTRESFLDAGLKVPPHDHGVWSLCEPCDARAEIAYGNIQYLAESEGVELTSEEEEEVCERYLNNWAR